MTIKEELIQYCKDCIDDKYVSEDEYYVSCKKHKWACQRLLDDFKKEKCKKKTVKSRTLNSFYEGFLMKNLLFFTLRSFQDVKNI